MTRHVHHDLKLHPSRDERARQGFVSTLRAHVLNTMAQSMKRHYEADIAPKLEGKELTGPMVHDAMKGGLYFKFYSAIRVKAQEMVWDSVRPTLEREARTLADKARWLRQTSKLQSRLDLDPALVVPMNVSAIDVHHMPGSYHHELQGLSEDITAGAMYDNGLSVFSFGLMGDNLDDIGTSIATYIRHKFPDFAPRRILDMGCTIGHNTQPWARAYPQAEVIGIDVSAPCLRYAHARSISQGAGVHYYQRDARDTGFEDASFDLIFSSMFLHELPKADIDAVLREARRLLRPGGLMLHYELPPNAEMSAYDGFYLDWDSAYNNEPYYKAYRDMSPAELCRNAGFADDTFFQGVVPSLSWYGKDAVISALSQGGGMGDDNTGRLADGIKWFIFGAWT